MVAILVFFVIFFAIDILACMLILFGNSFRNSPTLPFQFWPDIFNFSALGFPLFANAPLSHQFSRCFTQFHFLKLWLYWRRFLILGIVVMAILQLCWRNRFFSIKLSNFFLLFSIIFNFLFELLHIIRLLFLWQNLNLHALLEKWNWLCKVAYRKLVSTILSSILNLKVEPLLVTFRVRINLAKEVVALILGSFTDFLPWSHHRFHLEEHIGTRHWKSLNSIQITAL